MSPFLVIFAIVSIIFIILGMFILRNYKKQNSIKNSFSVVVCSRNEETMIIPLLESLAKIDYPTDSYDIILIDDNSTDNTYNILKSYSSKLNNCRVIKPNEKYSDFLGKKAGLQSAVDISNKDIILFTDADATVPINWLSSFNEYYTSQVGMVLGYIRGENLQGILKYKRIISSGIFASTVGINKPFSCTGGNLSVRRETLLEVGGYEKTKETKAGDDKLLLMLVSKTKWKVAYNSDVRLIERDRVLSKELLSHQAKRHYGKFSMSSPFHQFISILILMFYIVLPIALFVDYRSFLVYLEGILAFYICSVVRHKERLGLSDIIYSIVYPYYMLYYSIVGTFSEVKWKK